MVSSTEKYPSLRLVVSFCRTEAYLGRYQTPIIEGFFFVTIDSQNAPVEVHILHKLIANFTSY